MKDETTGVPSEEFQKNIDAIHTLITAVSRQSQTSFDTILALLKSHDTNIALSIPSSIFRDTNLGIMEAVTKYLKEEQNLSFHQIAAILGRDDRVVWVTYNKACKKKKNPVNVHKPNILLPISIFCAQEHGPLESITQFLHDTHHLSFKQIADLLNRDNRSIWACYHKTQKKSKKSSQKKGGGSHAPA